jgi:molybdopterin converting factor subunit 1
VKVEALYFAGARDIAGRSNETLDLPNSVTTVFAFLEWLIARYPDLGPHAPTLRIARNETFADPDEPLSENDVLAVIPPVAGG